MTTYAVFAPDAVKQARQTDAVLASLPLSYAPAPTASPGDVELVDGTGDWPAGVGAALAAGAAGVIVLRPTAVGAAALAALDAPSVPVLLDSPWAGNPVVADAADALRTVLDPRSRLECRVIVRPGADLRQALLDQLSLVRALVGAVSGLQIVHRDDHGYLAEGQAGDAAVDLSATCTRALPERAELRVLTPEGSVELLIPSPKTAQPALLSIIDPDGIHGRPTVFESAARATWRRLHTLLPTGGPAPDLAGFAADLVTVTHTDQHHG